MKKEMLVEGNETLEMIVLLFIPANLSFCYSVVSYMSSFGVN